MLAAIAPDVEAAYDDARPDLVRRTARKVKALDREHKEWIAWLRALRSVRQATERHDRDRQVSNGASTRMPRSLALADLVEVSSDPDSDPCRRSWTIKVP